MSCSFELSTFGSRHACTSVGMSTPLSASESSAVLDLTYRIQCRSISSRVLPLVSGTKAQTKTSRTAQNAP